MRMSDWSSDVCSSDLARTLIEIIRSDLNAHHRIDGFRFQNTSASRSDGLEEGEEVDGCTGHPRARRRIGVGIEKTPGREADRATVDGDDLKIGRASCRERVCQYV